MPLKPINTQTVSPTLGKSALKAGLAAGLAGLLLVLLYVILYYRALGLVVVSGLVVTAALLWAIISVLGHTNGLTLDLAGITGLIVSIGITVDSYIVYFERLKDETRAGRTVRTSVDRGFKSAWRTVLAADLVSLIGAVLLYVDRDRRGPGLRLLPRPVDPARHHRHVLLHPAAGHPARPQRADHLGPPLRYLQGPGGAEPRCRWG